MFHADGVKSVIKRCRQRTEIARELGRVTEIANVIFERFVKGG